MFNLIYSGISDFKQLFYYVYHYFFERAFLIVFKKKINEIVISRIFLFDIFSVAMTVTFSEGEAE